MFIDHFISCVYFFQWICTKIGCAAERPRGIWICSTWSKMYVFLQNILKLEESETLNTNISCQNICSYYRESYHNVPRFCPPYFFFQPCLWRICTVVSLGAIPLSSVHKVTWHFFFFWFESGILNLTKKKMWNFLSPLYPCRKSLAISQALKWISDAVFW